MGPWRNVGRLDTLMIPESIVSKLAEFVERRSARNFYWFTFAVIAFGYSLDFAGIAGNWAPRFGAVAAGTVAFSYFNDLRQHESWWQYLNNKRLAEREEAEEPMRDAKAEARLMSARGNDVLAKKHKTEAFRATRSQVRAVNERYNEEWSSARRAIRAEGRCVAIGTLVWAFGDIPVALWKCGVVSC